MKNRTILFLLSLMIVLMISWAPSEKRDPLTLYGQIDRSSTPNTLTAVEKKKGWNLLFDGKTTSGWHGFNLKGFPDCWVIDNGIFTTTTKGGAESQDIITNKKYRNFAFSVDFKLMKGTNSGIIFQIAEDSKYKFSYETGPEFQLIDQTNWPDPLKDWQICGANYAMYPPKSLPCKLIGEWNHLMLVVDGNHVTQIINGVIVVQYEKYTDEWKKLRDSGKWAKFPDYGKFDEGFISLQNHGTKVWYRSIKLKEIASIQASIEMYKTTNNDIYKNFAIDQAAQLKKLQVGSLDNSIGGFFYTSPSDQEPHKNIWHGCLEFISLCDLVQTFPLH